MKVIDIKQEFVAKGVVWGNCWGGGKCGYDTILLKSDNLEVLRQTINAELKTGSLDSGMGFESLYGAIMNITSIETIKLNNGKEFTRSEYEQEYFGDITDKEIEASDDY